MGLLYSCSGKKGEVREVENKEVPATDLSGVQLAQIHCSSCHLYVPPELLPRSGWKNDVLPAMAQRLGLYRDIRQRDSLIGHGIGGDLVRDAGVFPDKPLIARADWTKIVDYYLENALDSLVPPKRDKDISKQLEHFKYHEAGYSHRPPLTTMVKIRPDQKGVVYADGKRNINSLTFLTPDLEKDYILGLKSSPIHYREANDTLYLTTVGNSIFPHDAPDGVLQKITASGHGEPFSNAISLIDKLQRPVYMAYADLDNDGKEDLVACEYGNHTGKLVWFQNKGNDQYERHILNNRPGAISAVVRDMNGDGHQDIFALMAQGDEGIFYYENQGNGSFKEKRLLSFLPLYGSQYMELADFNGDGLDDILYVCGDNADKTPYLKDFHGIYIFLNDGDLNFRQAYFYPLNGAYKAMARDFDLDGDLDIASISFFPDYVGYPEESFVYLENKGDLVFEDFSFPQSTNGRWIVMDAGDMDGDGDDDLVLGSFVYFLPQGDTTGLGKKWLSTSPSLILLENTIK